MGRNIILKSAVLLTAILVLQGLSCESNNTKSENIEDQTNNNKNNTSNNDVNNQNNDNTSNNSNNASNNGNNASNNGAPTCGDDVCEGTEDCFTCPADCDVCCGDGECTAGHGETCATCPADCEAQCGAEVGALGGACFPNGTCNQGLTCEADICADQRGIEGFACAAGNRCNGESLACEADICVNVSGREGQLCRGGGCDAGLTCEGNLCVDRRGEDGYPCRADSTCDGTLECVGTACLDTCGVEGNTCCSEGDACDAGLTCQSGACVDLTGAEGGACYPNQTCNAGFLCNGGQCVATCAGSAPPADLSTGVCAGLLKVCSGTDWVDPSYTGIAGYELVEQACDSLDNDCDGNVDEGCDCTTGDTQPCGNDAGECEQGIQTCNSGGRWGDCEGGRVAYIEICDGLDNDCNGTPDDGLMPPPATKNRGVCQGLVQTCDGQAGWKEPTYTAIAQYEATESTCDGLDNDCDGQTDESLQAPLASRQQGVCAGAVKVCNGSWIEPNYATITGYQSAESLCDDLDNDCDGLLDEAEASLSCVCQPGAQQNCGVDTGECAFGTQTCLAAGEWSSCTGGTGAATEQCNGRDDDCDGQNDDNLTAPAAAKQNGVCGDCTKSCGGANGWREPTYAGINGCAEKSTLSVSLPTSAGISSCGAWLPGQCEDAAAPRLIGGFWGLTCRCSLYQTNETTCDSHDNDCDGQLDGADSDVPYPDNDLFEPNNTAAQAALLGSSPFFPSLDTVVQQDGSFNAGDSVDWYRTDFLNLGPARDYFECTVSGSDLADGLRVKVFVGLRTGCDAGCTNNAGTNVCCGLTDNTTTGYSTSNGCISGHNGEWTRALESANLGDGESVRLRMDMVKQTFFWNAAPCDQRGLLMNGRLYVRVTSVSGTMDRCLNNYRVSCRFTN